MLYFIGLFILVMAVSLDGLGVGITYGMRKIKIPVPALLIIMLCSGAIVLASMMVGDLLGIFISETAARLLGGGILITLGLFSLVNLIRTGWDKSKDSSVIQKETTKLNDLKTVITTPDKADLDGSGRISAGEACLLGTALSLDAFGAGIGAAILGYPPTLTAMLTAGMSGLFLYTGMKLGMLLSKNKKMQRLSFLPPALLIGIGILNIL